MKKWLAILLSITLVLGNLGFVFADDTVLTDVAGTKYEEAVEALVELNVVSGYPDGTYNPEGGISRAEMAVIVMKALGMADNGLRVYTSDFNDMSGYGWAQGYVYYSQKLGVISGYFDGTFKPGNQVTYNEAAAMLVNALGYEPAADASWPDNFVSVAEELGILDNIEGRNETANRGDAAVMAYQALEVSIKGDAADTMLSRLTGQEQSESGKIPYGTRLLNEYGLDGAAGVERDADILNSSYFLQPDFYNMTSSDSLTMLTNFKTIQQATEWTCGPTSAVMVLNWYGMLDDINEQDLVYLRQKEEPGATNLRQMINIFEGINESAGEELFQLTTTYDLVYDEDGYPMLEVEPGEVLYLEESIPYYLENGIPIIIGWQTWGGHYQVIIGYDDMGTEATQDDVLILADPYDTTDHNQDGYVIQSYERFIYDWSAGFDPDFDSCIFVAAVPSGYEYDGPVMGTGIESVSSNRGNFRDTHVIPFGTGYERQLAAHAASYDYPVYIGANGFSGPADSAYYRAGDHDQSPYYMHVDPYNLRSTSSRTILERFKTIQQTTEYNCGLTSMLMTLEWFGKRGSLNEMDLVDLRTKTDDLPGTNVEEMLNTIEALSSEWEVLSSYDLADEVINADGSVSYEWSDEAMEYVMYEMIPEYLEKGIPIMVCTHEWGGHWQVIIGYDTMGTEDTADDVIILADPYDTTDHNQDGYVIQSYERLIYDFVNYYDSDFDWGAFVIMSPK